VTGVQTCALPIFLGVKPVPNPLVFKGNIALDVDFPETPDIGWFYTVSASVTDPYHTHQTFVASDEIAWNGTTWVKLGSIESDPVFSAWLSANPTSGTNTGDQIGDGVTITGDGTSLNPFVVVIPPDIDEKVKYDANDPAAGYIIDKIISGDGINVVEGTGANENKLEIINIDKGSDVDLSGLVPYTGASGDVDLGAYNITAETFTATTTGLQLQNSSGIEFFADAGETTLGNLSILSIGQYIESIPGVGDATRDYTELTDNQTYTFPDATGTIALTSDIPTVPEDISDLTDTTGLLIELIDEDDMISDSDTKAPTQQSVKAYADGLLGAADAMTFKGVIDCSANPNYPSAVTGDFYKVSVAGKIGGASGVVVQAGDALLCIADNAGGTQASVGTSWTILQVNTEDATTDLKGIVELATQAEAQAKSSSTVVLTPASVADFTRKATGTIGDGTNTSYAVTHGLGSQFVTAQVYEESTDAQVECDIVLTSDTQSTFTFAVAPTTNQYRYVIVG
jgi:hypothetical protein